MANDNSTNTKKEFPTAHPRMPDLISKLREIRRANAGIGGCMNVLSRLRTNRECSPWRSEVYIQLTADDAACLEHAIEACSRYINEAFENLPVLGDVMWDDEYLPEVRYRAEQRQLMQDGEITGPEFERRLHNFRFGNGRTS